MTVATLRNLIVLTAFAAFATQAGAAGSRDLSEAARWAKSVAGKYQFQGSAGCDQLEVAMGLYDDSSATVIGPSRKVGSEADQVTTLFGAFDDHMRCMVGERMLDCRHTENRDDFGVNYVEVRVILERNPIGDLGRVTILTADRSKLAPWRKWNETTIECRERVTH